MAVWVPVQAKKPAPRSKLGGQARHSMRYRPRLHKPDTSKESARIPPPAKVDGRTEANMGTDASNGRQATAQEVKPEEAKVVEELQVSASVVPELVDHSTPVDACAAVAAISEDAHDLQNAEANAGEEQRSTTASKGQTAVSCPSGHSLQEFTTDLPAVCGLCSVECTTSSIMWGCRECDFDVCSGCRAVVFDTEEKIVGCAQDNTSTASTGTPRCDHDVTWTNVDDALWPDEADWPGDWHGDWPALCADETLLGPDGELYDIFYPADCPPEELSPRCPAASATSSHACSGDQQIECTLHSSGLDPSILQPWADPVHQQTSAELGIGSILAFMRGVQAVRYPARARLFETVQTATTIALGDHFERFALVGSTALRIDTPDSDLDAVVFTRSCTSISGEELSPPAAASTLRQVAKTLRACDQSLRLQLVDCTRVPVLTVFSGDGELSLDLTVDQPLSELHVLWLQSQRTDYVFDTGLMQRVPVPTLDGWEQGLEAAAVRCVKWWLRRRHIPVSKEGGYPTVVWTLMVIHALRCSVFYNEADDNHSKPTVDERTLLGAIAAFFDRFSEGGFAGTLVFPEGKHAEFWPRPSTSDGARPLPVLASEGFSVLDPTTTSLDSAAFGIAPLELAPRISSATQLLHAYELCRAQQLSALALVSEELSPNGSDGGSALSLLFAEVGEHMYLLPAAMPPEPTGVMFLYDGCLTFGILQRINLKHGWGASFLHRHDTQSRLAIAVCRVDVESHTVIPRSDMVSPLWLQPSDVVCLAAIRRCDHDCHWDPHQVPIFEIDLESLERWCKMNALLNVETSIAPVPSVGAHRKGFTKNRKGTQHRRHGKAFRI